MGNGRGQGRSGEPDGAAMSEDAGARMKARLRADLVPAMKGGRTREVALLRDLMAAIDNAEAVPVREERASIVRHEFGSGSAEVERRALGPDQVRDLLLREIEAREQAAAELTLVGQMERADDLRADVLAAKRYAED